MDKDSVTPEPKPPSALVSVKVWDIPTRLFHWAIVLLIAYLWWTAHSGDIAHHKLAGFLVVALVTFRLYWGFFGAETARFANFLRGPKAILRYARGQAGFLHGHNPLGGWSIVVMLAFLMTESVVGLFAIDEDGLDAGPFASLIDLDLAQKVAGWHALLFNVLLALVGVHLVAVLLYWFGGKNLIVPMVTGRRRAPTELERPSLARFWSLALGVMLAVGAFYALWRFDNS